MSSVVFFLVVGPEHFVPLVTTDPPPPPPSVCTDSKGKGTPPSSVHLLHMVNPVARTAANSAALELLPILVATRNPDRCSRRQHRPLRPLQDGGDEAVALRRHAGAWSRWAMTPRAGIGQFLVVGVYHENERTVQGIPERIQNTHASAGRQCTTFMGCRAVGPPDPQLRQRTDSNRLRP